MKPIDILLIALLALIVFFAARRTLRMRRSGGCGCGCPGCAGKRGGKCPSRSDTHTGG